MAAKIDAMALAWRFAVNVTSEIPGLSQLGPTFVGKIYCVFVGSFLL